MKIIVLGEEELKMIIDRIGVNKNVTPQSMDLFEQLITLRDSDVKKLILKV